MTPPSERQLQRCELLGWTYLGDGLFAKADRLGWFEDGHFKCEVVPIPDQVSCDEVREGK